MLKQINFVSKMITGEGKEWIHRTNLIIRIGVPIPPHQLVQHGSHLLARHLRQEYFLKESIGNHTDNSTGILLGNFLEKDRFFYPSPLPTISVHIILGACLDPCCRSARPPGLF